VKLDAAIIMKTLMVLRNDPQNERQVRLTSIKTKHPFADQLTDVKFSH
jgi:hypothetical protein